MRGHDQPPDSMFSYVMPEQRIPKDHPLRAICVLVDEILREMSREFDALYAKVGRPSIPPERLLRAQLLQVFYSIRSERLLMEQLDYNILFRWFVGLAMDEPIWDPTVFTKNRDRLLNQDLARGFLRRVVELTRKIEVGHPAKSSTDMGPLISSNQERVVQDYIKVGLDAGFELVTGGHKLSGDGYDHGYYVEPTIFDGVDNASKLSQEEIFGPLVTATTFKNEGEAIELANAVDFGLVAGVWTADYPRAMRVARRIRAGTVWIWDNYAQPVEGIWGGYKQSGMGRELGYHGLNDFLEVKQIFTDGTGLAMKPPYGQVIKE